MRKFIYLSNSIVPSRAANSVHVMKMCNSLATLFKVTLLCYSQEKKHDTNEIFNNYGVTNDFKIKSIPINKNRAKFFFNFFTIISFLKNQDKVTLVYGRDAYSVYLAALLGFQVYYESHGKPVSALYSFVENQLFRHRKFFGLIVISQKLKEIYENDHKSLLDNKIYILHDAADEIDFKNLQKIFKSGFHVGYIGSLYYQGRGVDIILELAKKYPDFIFHLIGGNESEINYWKERASSNVTFHGFIAHSEISKYLVSFDVVLMPYQLDLKLADMNVNTISWMSPMKMFEYMSARKAIIVSDLPVIREVLNDESSVLVTPDSTEEWSNAIRKIYTDSEFRKGIENKSYKMFLDHYTWLKRAEVLKFIIEK